MEVKAIWGIHTRDEQLFLQNDLIAIGWSDIGDLTKIASTRDAYKVEYRPPPSKMVTA